MMIGGLQTLKIARGDMRVSDNGWKDSVMIEKTVGNMKTESRDMCFCKEKRADVEEFGKCKPETVDSTGDATTLLCDVCRCDDIEMP